MLHRLTEAAVPAPIQKPVRRYISQRLSFVGSDDVSDFKCSALMYRDHAVQPVFSLDTLKGLSTNPEREAHPRSVS